MRVQNTFNHGLGEPIQFTLSGERGRVIGRSEFLNK